MILPSHNVQPVQKLLISVGDCLFNYRQSAFLEIIPCEMPGVSLTSSACSFITREVIGNVWTNLTLGGSDLTKSTEKGLGIASQRN